MSDHQITTNGYAPKLKRLQQLSRLLDSIITIPGTKIAIGLDPIIGLLPVGGDILGFILSFYIIIESAKMGVSQKTLQKMIINIIIDALIGSFPMLGDLFDFAWQANNYNLQLLEESLKENAINYPENQPNQKADQSFIIPLIIILLVLGMILLTIPIIIIIVISKILL